MKIDCHGITASTEVFSHWRDKYNIWLLIVCLVFIFRVNYATSLGAATALGVIFNFKTIGYVVFNSNDNSLIFKFIFIYILIFFINLGLIKLLVGAGLDAYAAGVLVIIPSSVISFILNKYYVFKR